MSKARTLSKLLGGTVPSALDTLNEISTALNNDASLASTITTALAGKQASIGYTPAAGQASFQALNLDAVKQPGLYQYDGAFTGTKPPDNSGNYRTLEIGDGGRYTQIAFPWNSNRVFVRRKVDANWGGWDELVKFGDTYVFTHGGNSGEARFGRADDRGIGVATLQLGGTSGQRFEVVDKDWSDVLFAVQEDGRVDSYAGHLIRAGNKSGYANRTLGVVSGDKWTNGSTYVHILLPERYNSNYSRMFQLLIQGYALDMGANRNINLMVSGYVTPVSNGGPMASVSGFDPSGVYSPTAYYSSGYNRGVVRFYLSQSYYTTFVVDALQAGNGDSILPGELTVIFNSASTI
jgi:hypothetical protein